MDRIPFFELRTYPLSVVAVFFVTLLGCLLFYSWSRLATVHANYDIRSMIQKEAQLSNENNRLKLEIAVLKSPDRIENIAITKFNLKYPAAWQVVRLKNN